MRLVLETDDGHEVAAQEYEEEQLYLLYRDLEHLLREDPDTPDAWNDQNLRNVEDLLSVLDAPNL